MTLTRDEAADWLDPKILQLPDYFPNEVREFLERLQEAHEMGAEALRLVENAERELEAKIQYHVEMYRIYEATGDKIAALTQMSNFAITSACLDILIGKGKPWWKLTPRQKRQAILFRRFIEPWPVRGRQGLFDVPDEEVARHELEVPK